MKLLVGLGNPGRQHVLNRHNLGFIAVESFVLLKGEEFRKEEFQSHTARLKVSGEDVLVMKPKTFMNRSGEAVGEALRFFKLTVDDLIVVHDEVDLPPMTFRLKKGGGTAGNNGLKSIVPLGDSFARVRMGIGRPPHPDMQVADYVLGNLEKDELNFWETEMSNVCEAIDLCIAGKTELAMNKFNRKAESKTEKE
ncbi:MAG TPA: aminoacyl-tRNA hydrolase [Bdellovibrionota bacterium]|jgi:PTH1 family peptidyl-tRNA hydrolase